MFVWIWLWYKVTPVRALKAYRGCRGITPVINLINIRTTGIWVVRFSGRSVCLPLNGPRQQSGWIPGPISTFRKKIFFSAESRTPVSLVYSLASVPFILFQLLVVFNTHKTKISINVKDNKQNVPTLTVDVQGCKSVVGRRLWVLFGNACFDVQTCWDSIHCRYVAMTSGVDACIGLRRWLYDVCVCACVRVYLGEGFDPVVYVLGWP
jgi:hypothetical protein